eukprot:4188978-Pleurochrysis_carterae.AAC.1
MGRGDDAKREDLRAALFLCRVECAPTHRRLRSERSAHSARRTDDAGGVGMTRRGGGCAHCVRVFQCRWLGAHLSPSRKLSVFVARRGTFGDDSAFVATDIQGSGEARENSGSGEARETFTIFRFEVGRFLTIRAFLLFVHSGYKQLMTPTS